MYFLSLTQHLTFSVQVIMQKGLDFFEQPKQLLKKSNHNSFQMAGNNSFQIPFFFCESNIKCFLHFEHDSIQKMLKYDGCSLMFICEQGKSSNCIIHLQSRNFSLLRILFIHYRTNIKYVLSKRHLCHGHLKIYLEKVPNDYLSLGIKAKSFQFAVIILCVSTSCLPKHVTASFRAGFMSYTSLSFTK